MIHYCLKLGFFNYLDFNKAPKPDHIYRALIAKQLNQDKFVSRKSPQDYVMHKAQVECKVFFSKLACYPQGGEMYGTVFWSFVCVSTEVYNPPP